jgi:hypothetical protein
MPSILTQAIEIKSVHLKTTKPQRRPALGFMLDQEIGRSFLA